MWWTGIPVFEDETSGAYSYNRGQFSLRNLNAAHQKQLFPIPPLEFLQVTSPSPPPPIQC